MSPCGRGAALCALACLLAARATLAAPPTPLIVNKADEEFAFPLDGGTLRVTYEPGAYLYVECDNVSLARSPLPVVVPNTTVGRATFKCAPPPAGYRDALARLHVDLLPRANLTLTLPPAASAPPLQRAHLAGLAFDRLTLQARRVDAPHAPPRADLLRGLDLRALQVHDVPLPAAALDEPPAALTALGLPGGRVPAAALERLATLSTELTTGAELEGAAPTLRTLTLNLHGAAPPELSRFPALRTLTLCNWTVAEAPRWEVCPALEVLTLVQLRAAALPERWLVACGTLRELRLQSCVGHVGLPGGLLEGARSLETLAVTSCGLEALPTGLLNPVPNLVHLNLRGNRLRALPSGLFARPAGLRTVILSHNRLDSRVYGEVGALRELSELSLSNNPLGDACTGDALGRFGSGDSPLHHLKALEKLDLSWTLVTRICRDWRELPRLYFLDLNHTNITRLSYSDLQLKRDSATSARVPPPSVELYGAPVATVDYSAEDEDRARTAPPARVTVRLPRTLRCDCGLFHFTRALRQSPHHASLGALRCADGRDLSRVLLDDLLSAFRDRGCPAACACAECAQGTAARPAWLLRVACERAGLRALPRLPPAARGVRWDLRLAGNRIIDLDDLPLGLHKLDIQNNSVSSVSTRAALTLRDAADVRLAGNPLRCGCALLGAASALAARGALGAAHCEGRALAAAAQDERARCAAEQPAGPGAALYAAGALAAALALAALASASALASPRRRAFVKAKLIEWGWLPRPAEPDDGRPFDAFVSFSHEDEAFARKMIAELESGARPLRLCLHSRDWMPGEFIGAQIAASVRNARRTVVLVSRPFLQSTWARAEFREAAGASARDLTPRLVLVFLAPPAELPLDRELRRYVEANTYLEASNPNFWKLLRRALPPPREPAPPPAAPPAPTTVSLPPAAAPPPAPTTVSLPPAAAPPAPTTVSLPLPAVSPALTTISLPPAAAPPAPTTVSLPPAAAPLAPTTVSSLPSTAPLAPVPVPLPPPGAPSEPHEPASPGSESSGSSSESSSCSSDASWDSGRRSSQLAARGTWGAIAAPTPA